MSREVTRTGTGHAFRLVASAWSPQLGGCPPDQLRYGTLGPEHGQASSGLHILAVVGDVYQALADPTRRKILDELAGRDGQTLFEICSRLAMKHRLTSSRQAISQHLDVLEAAGLIVTRREGRCKYHHLDRRPLEHIADRWLRPDLDRRPDENQPD
jgi:DNA-binding transcriptional ArsR family regulator